MHAARSNLAQNRGVSPSFHNYKKISSKQPSLSAGTTPTLNFSCFTSQIIHSSSYISMLQSAGTKMLLCFPLLLRKAVSLYVGEQSLPRRNGRKPDVCSWMNCDLDMPQNTCLMEGCQIQCFLLMDCYKV
jgi:hypothetical protein